VSALTYEEALRALQERGRFGIRLGLGRTRALLRELGDPQLEFRGALVAGTNGKGSVLALAGSALRAAGLRIAETPKPHLVSYRERLQVDGRLVDPTTFARLVSEVIAAADQVGRRSHGQPTEFELLTAVAFRWFAEMRVDLALVEVGLGGRLDATHAWDGGVAAITNVDLDHTDRLGPTVTAIAREKAAIIERGDLAVTGATGEALQVVRRRAHRLGVPLTEVLQPDVTGWDRDSITVTLPILGETRIGLRGRHQAVNAAVAEAVLDALEVAGIATVPADARRGGYAEARWPGRLELIETVAASNGGSREVLLDGAHNPAGAAVLARALDDLRPTLQGGDEPDPPRITLLLATMADKDVAGILAALAASPIARAAQVVCTEIDHPRSLSAANLAKGWAAVAPGSRPDVVTPVNAALDRALSVARGPVVVAGSLYLVGAVRAILVDDPELRDDAAHRAPRAVGPETLAAVR
jgi:dihydrofolate synthase / folylpolyglutamate synthase